MKETWKRALSVLLAVCLMAGMLVIPAAAEGEDDTPLGGGGEAETYTITKAPAENGSFTVTVAGEEVEAAAEGVDVTVTATAGEGYELETIVVTKDTVNTPGTGDGTETGGGDEPDTPEPSETPSTPEPSETPEETGGADDESDETGGLLADGTEETVDVTMDGDGDSGTFVMPATKVTVTVTFTPTQGGGSGEDPNPTPGVDKSALTAAIDAANTAKEGVETSADGTDVDPAKKWVTSAQKAALENAITTAQNMLEDERATQDQVDQAVTDLNAAVTDFEAAQKDGTKNDTPAPSKTMDVTAEGVNRPYNGQPASITVTVNAPADGSATVTYRDENGDYTLTTSPTRTDVGTTTVDYKVTAADYNDYTGSATITITKATAPTLRMAVEPEEVDADGETVDITVFGVPTGVGVLPVVKVGEDTVDVTEDGPGAYKGTYTVAPNTESTSKSYTVQVNWPGDANHTGATYQAEFTQLGQGQTASVPVTGLGLLRDDLDDYGVTATPSNTVFYIVDEGKLQAAWANEAKHAVMNSSAMRHADRLYFCFTFEAPEGFDKDTWTIDQSVDGGVTWSEDVTADMNVFDKGGKTLIGDWFSFANVDGDTLTLDAVGSAAAIDNHDWRVRYRFSQSGEEKAVYSLHVQRAVVEAVTVTVDGENLDTVQVNGVDYVGAVQVSPNEDLIITVTAAEGYALPEEASVGDNTYTITDGTITIPATDLTGGTALTVTVNATQGGDEPGPGPDDDSKELKAAKDALQKAIDAANVLVESVTLSAQADNIPGVRYWDEALKSEYKDAIAEAQGVKDSAAVTAEDVRSAEAKLATATNTFKDGKLDGTRILEGDVLKNELDSCIKLALKAKEGVVENDATDPDNVTIGTRYVSKAVMKALNDALKAAQDVKALLADEDEENDPDDAAITVAVVDLTNATNDFKPTTGTHSTGGGGGRLPNYGAGTPAADGTTTPDDTTTEDTDNGSTRVTETWTDGTVVVTETWTDGTKAVTTITPDGDVSTKVTLGKDVKHVKVSVPVEGATTAMVPVIVHDNGDEEIIRDSVVDDGEVRFELDADATVKIMANAKRFEDMVGHWAVKDVNYVTARELFNGVDASHFAPDTAMTRGMMATVLFRLDGENAAAQKNVDFTDVRSNDWFVDAVDWAAKAGVINGYTDGTFAPNRSITREELVVMIYRYAGAPKVISANSLDDFSDMDDVSSWAETAMAWAVRNGIINGRTNGTLDPRGNATRAEVSAVLRRYVSLTK